MGDYVKVSATNTAGGPRIFRSAPPVILPAGASTDGDVDILPAELESMKLYGEFEISDGSAPPATGPDTSILDGNVPDVKAALDSLDVDHLKALREAEVAGKNRAGALVAIDEEIAAKGQPAA